MEISIKWSMCRACLAERCTTLRPLLESEAAKHLKELAGLVVSTSKYKLKCKIYDFRFNI